MVKKRATSWGDVKNRLSGLDRVGLIALVQDLYTASKDNQSFLRARFALGDDVLKPYKITIDRWLWPDVLKNQDVSVAKAKKAITDYKKAIGQPDDLAELMVHYCERAVGFCSDVGYADEGYFDALVRMFEQALKAATPLPAAKKSDLLARLDDVCLTSDNFGYGVHDAMNTLLDEYGVD